MAYTATTWTVSIISSERMAGSRLKRVVAKCTLPTGSAIPAVGVPLPKGKMGFTNVREYILLNDVDSAFTTASARALMWILNVTGERVRAFKASTASAAAAQVGGRAVRKLATTVTIDTSHVLFIEARGF